MNLGPHYYDIAEALDNMKFTREREDANSNGRVQYVIKNLNRLRKAVLLVRDIPYLGPQMHTVVEHPLFKSPQDEYTLSTTEYLEFKTLIEKLKNKLQVLKEIVETDGLSDLHDMLSIRIPALNTFDELSKVADELKKSIELPLIDSRVESNVKIVGADRGSIIFYVSLGAAAAVKLIGVICWSAAVIRRERAEARILEEHAKTLQLKNESLRDLIEAQREQLRNITQGEAERIVRTHYDQNDPEAVERLKLSINSISELIDRGVTILPNGNDRETLKSFPDYSQLSLIESTIKQLKKSAETPS